MMLAKRFSGNYRSLACFNRFGLSFGADADGRNAAARRGGAVGPVVSLIFWSLVIF